MGEAGKGRIVAMQRGSCAGIEVGARELIRCVEGSLWLTLEGIPGDVVIGAGECWIAPRGGWLVAQPLGGSARAAVEAPLPGDARHAYGEPLQASHLA